MGKKKTNFVLHEQIIFSSELYVNIICTDDER